jgi:hypothetical protein
MRALHSIRTEMRENALSFTRPFVDEPAKPARVLRGMPEEKLDLEAHIEPWMANAFKHLVHSAESGEPFALVPCFMNGEPAAVIALAQRIGGKMHVMPLFLACQPWMDFSGQPGAEGDGGEEGGGPHRDADDSPAPR